MTWADAAVQAQHLGLRCGRGGALEWLPRFARCQSVPCRQTGRDCRASPGGRTEHQRSRPACSRWKITGVDIENVGFIFFGEAVITPTVQRVSLMRFEFGCGCQGEGHRRRAGKGTVVDGGQPR